MPLVVCRCLNLRCGPLIRMYGIVRTRPFKYKAVRREKLFLMAQKRTLNESHCSQNPTICIPCFESQGNYYRRPYCHLVCWQTTLKDMETTPVDDPRPDMSTQQLGCTDLLRDLQWKRLDTSRIGYMNRCCQLANIRKTGSFYVHAAAPAGKDTWLDKRLEGKELMRVKTDSLQLVDFGRQDSVCML